MAVGSRLSMATYTKKESQNPGIVGQPSYASQLNKTLKQRKQQKQEKTNKFLDKLAPNQKGRTSKSMAPFGAATGTGKPSLNSDLFPLGKVKSSQGFVANKTGRGAFSRVPTQESKESSNLEIQQFLKTNAQPSRAIRPATLYKTGKVAQTTKEEEASQRESQVLQANSIAEAMEEPGYLPMNINVTNGVIRGPVFQPHQSQVSNKEMLQSRSPSVSQMVDPEDTGSFDILADQGKHGKKKLTVNTVQATKKLHVSQFHLDQDHSDLNIEESKDHLATASIVTQNYNLKDIGDDYQTTVLLTGSKNSSVQQKQLPHIKSQKFKVHGVTVPNSSSPPQHRRSMAMMKESDTTVVGAGLEFKYASLTCTPPNLEQKQQLEGHKRAQSTMSGKTSQMIKVTRGQSRAEGGITTTMLPPQKGQNFRPNRSPSVVQTAQNIKVGDILTGQELRAKNGRGSTPNSARDDFNDKKKPSNAIKLHDAIVDAPINILRCTNLSSGRRTAGGQKEAAMRNAMLQNQTSRGKITSNMSAANFSNLERQQNIALLGITGNTLSQLIANQNVKNGNWKQQQQMVFTNLSSKRSPVAQKPAQTRQQEVVQSVASGMKGGKLAKNSYFRRMQVFQKKRDETDATCGDCLSYNSNEEKNILLGITDPGFYAPLSNRIDLYSKDSFPQRSPTSSHNDKAAKRQSITVQNRPKTQDDYRWKLTTALQDNYSQRGSPKQEVDKVVRRESGVLLGNMNLRSWNSSNEQDQQDQIEDLKATVDGAKENEREGMGTIHAMATQTAGDVSRSISFNSKVHEQRIQMMNPQQTRSGAIPSQDLQEVDFQACVRRESGGLIVHDRIQDRDPIAKDYATAQLSQISNRDMVLQSLIKIEVDSKASSGSGIHELQNNQLGFQGTNYDDPGTKPLNEGNKKETKTGVILNFPLPEDMDTIRLKRINSGGSSDGYLENVPEATRQQQRRPTFSPQMRILQKKDGQPRNSKSQNMARRRQQMAKPVIEDSMVVGTKFKPRIVFKESDLQHLFDSAEQPVQQMISKVLLDDIDLYDGYGYQSQVKKYQKVKQLKSAFSRQNDHLKYEFIERLLKKPDQEMTRKTLTEMTMLYQDLLEKNLSNSSSVGPTQMNKMSLHDQGSIAVNSQQSIIVLTDQKGNAVFEKSVLTSSRTKEFIELKSSKMETSNLGRVSVLQGHRGSLQDDRLQLKLNKGCEATNQTVPLISVSPKKMPSLQSMSEVDYNKDLVTVGKIIQNSSGSNTLFLELGQQKWSSNIDDYGGQLAKKSTSNSPGGTEIDGKKQNILRNLRERQDSNNILTQTTVRQNESGLQKINSGQFECASAPPREETILSQDGATSQLSANQKLTQSKVKVALESARKKAAMARQAGEPTQLAKVLLSHTPNQANTTNKASKEQSPFTPADAFSKTKTVNELFKNRKFTQTSLSPRIAAIEAKINSKNASQQVKTQEDVQSLVSILGLGIGTDLDEQFKVNSEILQKIDLLSLQTARSAYLTYRANQMNPNKVVVGNEVRDLNERKKFVEQLFHPIGGGQDVNEFQSKLLSLYEKKLASQVGGRTATAMSGTKQSDSTKRGEHLHKSDLMISGKEATLKEPKPRSSSKIEASRSALAKRSKIQSNASVRSGNQSPMSPFATASDYKDKMWGVGSTPGQDRGGGTPGAAKSMGTQVNGKMADQSSNLAKYQKKEEQGVLKDGAEKKNVLKHELKVPKAGKLDTVKQSRMRKLSSNQVTGFCLRKVTSNLPTESEGSDNKWLYQTQYGLGSNQDLVELLRRPKNKSSINVFNQGSEVDGKEEDLLCVNSDDAEEVGTQMMISRKNLQFPVPVTQISIASPKGPRVKVDQLLNSQASDEGNSMINLADAQSKTKKDEPIIEEAETKGKVHSASRKLQVLNKVNSVNSNDSSAVQKIGTIQVKELYQLRENASSQIASKDSSAPKTGQKIPQSKQSSALNTQSETNVINLGLLRAQKQKKSQSQTANFERLSGLISESNTDQKKAKLLAHYKRIKEAKRISKNNADWKRATPCISRGSTFYKDLFELRSQVREGSRDVTDLNISQVLNQTLVDLQPRDVNDDSLDLLRQTMMMFSQTQQQRPQISNLLRPDPKRGKRQSFSVSKNALTPSSKKLISQLLAQVKGSSLIAVQPLKQSCLVQYILEEWATTLNGQMKQFEHSCTFSDSLRLGKEGNLTTEAYSVILYGNQTPVSNCCKQLICFQFTKNNRQVSVYCLETTCNRSKLESRSLNSEIFHTAFLTTKKTSNREVIYHKESPSKKQKILLVSNQGTNAQQNEQIRKHITLSSQSVRSPPNKISKSNSKVLTPQNRSDIHSPFNSDALSGKYQHSSQVKKEDDLLSGEVKLQPSNETKGIEVTMQLNQKNGGGQKEQGDVIKYFQRQQTLLRPSWVSPTNTSDQFSLEELEKGALP